MPHQPVGRGFTPAVYKIKNPCSRRQQAAALRLVRHPERSKHHGAVFAQSNFQKRTTNRAFLKGKGQSPLRISHGASRAFWVNVTLRTRAIVYPLWIPSSLSLLGFACSDRVFGNLLCKSAALPPQKLPLLAAGELMLRPAKLRLLRSLPICKANGAVQATRQSFSYFAFGEVGSG